MPGIVSSILNYYGYLHLAYYSSHQFLPKVADSKLNKSTNDTTTADETLVVEDGLYMWLSKWVVFITYIYVEPVLLAILDFVPGIYFLSIVLKMKLLSSNNQWHQLIYDKTFGHLQEFDIFEFAWSFSSNRIVALITKILSLLSYLSPKLNGEQLDELAESLQAAADEVRQAKISQEAKKNIRMSKILNRSAFEDFRSGKKTATVLESQVINSK